MGIEVIHRLIKAIVTWSASLWKWLLERIYSQSKVKIKLPDFVDWFEPKLLNSLSADLSVFNTTVQKVNDLILQLKNLSDDSRSLASITTNTNSRTLRICDQIDSLFSEYIHNKHCNRANSSPDCLYPINSTLPDAEYIREMTSRIRNRLKVIDEIVVSKKNDSATKAPKGGNNSGGKGDSGKKPFEMPASIRADIRTLTSTLEALDSQYAVLTTHLSYLLTVKQAVHRPISGLVSFAEQLTCKPTARLAKHTVQLAAAQLCVHW